MLSCKPTIPLSWGFGATMCLVLGETLWSHPRSFSGNASILSPLLQVPDIDGDGAPDLLMLSREGQEVISIALKCPGPLPSRPPLYFLIHFSLKRIRVATPQCIPLGLCALRSTHPTRWEAPLQAACWPSP